MQNLKQISLPISIDETKTILHAPIVEEYFDEVLRQVIEVVGGRFAGSEFVYLIHLDSPLHRVQHYLGSTNNLLRRKHEHGRKYPTFRFSDQFYSNGFKHGIDQAVLDDLEPLRNKTFRRYHTIESALRRQLGESQALRWKFCVMGAARQHTTNGIIMAANRADISWRMVRVFRADRSLERALKKHKLSFRHICPACQGIEMPF